MRRTPFGLGAPEGASRLALPVVDPDSYAITGEFARGGIGRVLRARDKRLGRTVALKILLAYEREAQRRFMREALVTARLQHPGIVPIYEAGRFPDGRPFYAMRLVSGEPLAVRLRTARGLEGRLALLPHVTQAAEAIAYAHSCGVIHRDVKPDNILVGAFGETVVIDWGFAKVLAADMTEDILEHDSGEFVTVKGTILGTPSYMAPEQASGIAVDARADVYALGAILYRILAGRRPYEDRNPAHVLRKLAHGPPPRLEDLAPFAPRELVAIAEKAMARSAEDRYRSVRELCDDLRRFQTGQLVGAHRYSSSQLARRWLVQHAVAVLSAIIALTALAAVGAFSVHRVLAERDHEAQAGREARRAEARAVGAEAAARAAGNAESTRADEAVLRAARAALLRDPTAAVAWLKQLSPAWDRWDAARPVAVAASRRGLADLLRGQEGEVTALAFSADGKRLAVGGGDQRLRVFELEASRAEATAPMPDVIAALAFSPLGGEVAIVTRAGAARIVPLAPGATPRELPAAGAPLLTIAYAPDGKRLAAGDGRGATLVYDLVRGAREVSYDHPGTVRALAFSASGERLASSGADGVIFLREGAPSRGRVIARDARDPHDTGAITALALAPDGRSLAYASADGAVRVASLGPQEGGAIRLVAKNLGEVSALAFAPDGKLFIAASVGIAIWDLAAGAAEELRSPDRTLSAALSPDGKTVARAGTDGGVRLIRRPVPEPPTGSALRSWIEGATNAVVGSDGELVADAARPTGP